MKKENPKFLLDTNIIIGLEQNQKIDESLSEMLRLCHEHTIPVYVHVASIEDIQKDADKNRREITLSKLKKFPTLKDIPTPDQDGLEALYGKISKSNDLIDCKILYALDKANAASFLITEDRGLLRRARNVNLSGICFSVDEAIEWIKTTFGQKEIYLPRVEQKECYQLNKADPIFASLEKEYKGFAKWFATCCATHRKCWVAMKDKFIAGIVIWKDESDNIPAPLKKDNVKKLLKICTFKVSEDYRGDKLGEQLLKQVLWFAASGKYDEVYLTVFPHHTSLIELISFYGFHNVHVNEGELWYAKKFAPHTNEEENLPPLEFHKRFYPVFRDDNLDKFVFPIRPEYHAVLFPEAVEKKQGSLFGDTDATKPGNCIKKVYLSHAPCKNLKQGDLMIFYMSKDPKGNHLNDQSITTVGVVEHVSRTSSLEELHKLTAKRSVYRSADLEEYIAHCAEKGEKATVTIIDFLICGHARPVRKLKNLL